MINVTHVSDFVCGMITHISQVGVREQSNLGKNQNAVRS